MPVYLGKAAGVIVNITDNHVQNGTRLTDTGKVIDYCHEGYINSIDSRRRSGGTTITNIPEVAHHQIGLAAAALGNTILFG